MKRILCMILAAMLLMGLLAGCSSDPITEEEAKQIVLDDLGVEEKDVELHVHTETVNGITYYNIYVTVDGEQLAYQIHGGNGKILSKGEGNHSH